jgi:hypothetical protein
MLTALTYSALAVFTGVCRAGEPAPTGAQHRSALVVFLSTPPGHRASGSADQLERELENVPGLSIGLMSATQGTYRTAQLLLDVTQGARVSYSTYKTSHPPALRVLIRGAGGVIEGWKAALKRANDAPQILKPGLLASQIPGGGAYLGISGQDDEDAALAANRAGEVSLLSQASSATLLDRIGRARQDRGLLVADLDAGAAGYLQLRSLVAERPAGELLIVLERAPDLPGHELLWVGVAGLGAGGQELSSQSTNQRGMLVAVDLAPTILGYLGLPVPSAMRGEPVHEDGSLHGASLRALKARLGVISKRRLPALGWLLVAWIVALIAARSPRTRAGVMRAGALAMLWTPVAVLITAALEPSAAVEYLLLVLCAFSLGALSDLLIAWPRALIAPAAVAILALSIDALAGTQLLMRSLLGPNPIFGARFYGIGNELKSGLAVLVLAAAASMLYPAVRGARAATWMALATVVLAVVEGSARIGAGVGGVILVSAGGALAVLLALGGRLNTRRTLILLISPVVGLLALAVLDLATAHGSGHFTGSVLHARSLADVRDIIERRYRAAWDALKDGAMPAATVLAIAAAVTGVRLRNRLLKPVAGDPGWLAALGGGLTAGVVGALAEDSGPVLLVVAVFALGCVLSYLWGRPPARELTSHETRGR